MSRYMATRTIPLTKSAYEAHGTKMTEGGCPPSRLSFLVATRPTQANNLSAIGTF